MNHLAHLALARPNEKLMVGGYIADAVKGKNFREYEEEIAKGILLHRFIDLFTDTHEVVSGLKKLLRPQFGLLSGIVIDMYFDNQLAKHWNEFENDPLEDFTHQCYLIFEKYESIMPERPRRMFPYMREENWLLRYRTVEGMARSFIGMSRRIRKGELLVSAASFMQAHDEEIRKSFFQFYPELKVNCTAERLRLNTFAR